MKHYTTAVNWVDAAIVGIVILYVLIGIKRGFLVVASELATLALGFGLAFALFRPVGAFVASTQGVRPGMAQLGAFLVIWVAVQLLASVALHVYLKKVPKETMKNPLNRDLGVFPSLVKGIIAAALIVTLLSVAPSGTAARDVRGSALGQPLVNVVVRLEEGVYDTFRDAIGDIQTSLGRNPVVDKYQELPFKTRDVEAAPQAEEEMLRLVNRERREHGLEPLVEDETLRQVARRHSKDMLARGYFSHVSPDGDSPFDRMRAAGVTYRTAGENLALALTVQVAHEGLMKSPGHRKNILTPEYRRVGIGAIRAGARGTMFTQNFTD